MKTTSRALKPAIVLLAVAVAVSLPSTGTRAQGMTEYFSIFEQLAPLVPSMSTVSHVAREGYEAGEKGLELIDIAQRSLAQLGTDISMEVTYEPPDATDAIHAKHDPDEDLERRRVTMTALVEYAFDLEEEIPLARQRGWVGKELPRKGPRSGVQVRWYFAPELLKHAVLRAHDFRGMNPTFYDTTRRDGRVVAHLYPIPDHPLGGVRKVAEGDVRAWAKTQTAREVPRDMIGAIMTAGEDFIPGGCQTTKRVRIEYHAPTRWEGSLSVYRTVTKTYGVSAREPAEFGERRVTSVSGNELWSSTLKVDHFTLDTDGIGRGDYSLKIDGEGKHTRLSKYKTYDRRTEPVVWPDKIVRDLKGHGEENGWLGLRLDVSRHEQATYVLLIEGNTGSKALTPPIFSGNGEETHTWTDDDGEHSVTSGAEMQPGTDVSGGLAIRGSLRPRGVFQFDRDARSYANSADWEEEYTSKDGGVHYHVDTQVQWTLNRVPDSSK